jgi:hypothetical protein
MMQREFGEGHVAWPRCGVQSSQDQSQPLFMLELDSAFASSLKKSSEPFVREALDHILSTVTPNVPRIYESNRGNYRNFGPQSVATLLFAA